MNVYVESNFVLEHALEQEECDICAEIIRLATNRRVTLVIPAFSLAEPHQAILGKAKARARLGADLRAHLSDLGRSKPHRGIPASFDALSTVLIASAEFEREGLHRSIGTLLDCSQVIPLDSSILRAAAEIRSQYGLSAQDSIVLASVLVHLQTNRPNESCFLNRNAKDFDEPDIRDRLEALGCKFSRRFLRG